MHGATWETVVIFYLLVLRFNEKTTHDIKRSELCVTQERIEIKFYTMLFISDLSLAGYAGALMVAPVINPYEPSMTKKERSRIWENWTSQRKLMYMLAHRFPSSLAFLYRRSFLSGNHGQIDKWLSLSVGKRVCHLVIPTISHKLLFTWEQEVTQKIGIYVYVVRT